MDSRTEEIRRQIKALPEQLMPARADLERLQTLLEIERKKLNETETWRADQEELIRADTEGVKAAKTKLTAAKSTRDFAMANREIDNKRRSVSAREEEVLKVLHAIEESKKALEAQEAQVAEIAEGHAAEEAKVAELVAELEVKVVESSTGREAIAEKIEKAIARKYNTVLKRRAVAVVPVNGGACSGCHMTIPRQLNNILARGETIETCPACYQLLYRPELLETPADEE